MRPADDVLAGQRGDLVPGEREPERLQPLEDLLVAPGAAVEDAGEILAQLGVGGIDAVAQDVQGAGRHLGADFHARDPDDLVPLAGLEERRDAVDVVVVGQRERRQAQAAGGGDERLGRVAAVREGRMDVEVDHAWWQV